MRRWLVSTICLLFLNSIAQADSPAPPTTSYNAIISIIIDDLGYRYKNSSRVVHMPWDLTCSFLPLTPHAKTLAQQAHLLNKEIMLHLPMEAISGKTMGPGGLRLGMRRPEFEQTLKTSLAAIPYARGLNNHMGSLLTRNGQQMGWLMQKLAQRGDLYFVDSRTTLQSQAMAQAELNNVLATDRDVFLDHELGTASIQKQFQRLLNIAKLYGSALAIGHPHDVTLDFLEQNLPSLAQHGVRLVPVSRLIQFRSQKRLAWQTSSSP